MNVNSSRFFVPAVLILILLGAGCSDRNPADLELAQGNTDPLVFDDAYNAVYFQPFFQTHYYTVSSDSVFAYGGFAGDGARSLKFNIAPEGTALGAYTGGVLTAEQSRDLAEYNALTFYARASEDIALDAIGYGNDNTGNSLFEAGTAALPLTSEWTFFTIPIPAASKLRSEMGMLTIAESLEPMSAWNPTPKYPNGYDIYLDEIKFAKMGNIANPRPEIPSSEKDYFVGSSANVTGAQTIFEVDGYDMLIHHMAGYFDFASDNSSVAVIDRNEINIVGVGQATVTAILDDVAVAGEVILRGQLPPTVSALSPTHLPSDVISLYSSAYIDVPVDSWNTHWNYSTAEDGFYTVNGHETRMYSALNFVGIEFLAAPVDASEMTHFHMDVYTPEGTDFIIKFITFDETNSFAGGAELIFDSTTVPAFNSGGWSSLDIPLSDFEFIPANDAPWDRVGQLVLSTTDSKLVLLDNIYWFK